MPWAQIIMVVWLILCVIIVPANDEFYWKWRYSLIARMIRVSLLAALLWWGGFFEV